MSIETKLFISHGREVKLIKDFSHRHEPVLSLLFVDNKGRNHKVEIGYGEKGIEKKLTKKRCDYLFKTTRQSNIDEIVGRILSLCEKFANPNQTVH